MHFSFRSRVKFGSDGTSLYVSNGVSAVLEFRGNSCCGLVSSSFDRCVG